MTGWLPVVARCSPDGYLTPELVEEFVRAFEQELAELQRSVGSERLRVSKELDGVSRRLEGVLRAIEKGAWNDTLKARLTELERSKATLADQLARLDIPAPPRLHPNAAAIYRDKVATLQASLNLPDISTEATSILRQLIDKVVLTPDADAPDGLWVELHGDLAMILALSQQAPARKASGSGGGGTSVPSGLLSVVAGIGFEPMTFRL